MRLSKNFSLAEFIHSETALEKGIVNNPPDHILERLKFTAAGLERVRAALKFPIKVTSGYRCTELNIAVGGAPDSQHVQGYAVDFQCTGFGDPRRIVEYLQNALGVVGIDQLIIESSWVHVSFNLNPRAEILTFKDGKYLKGIV